MTAIGITQTSTLAPETGKAKTAAAAASVFAILDRKSKIDPSDKSGLTLKQVEGKIDVQHVKFKYPTRPDVQIFRDLSLTIHPGKVILEE